jgi:hypothetical protein
MSGVWEPPGGRAAGGLLGVAGGEAYRGVAVGSSEGPVTAALVDLCHGYVASRGRRVPVDVGERHEGVATPAWMVAVAVVRPTSRELVSDTLELALAARVPRGALADCVAYVELASALFAGRSVDEAIDVVGAGGASRARAGARDARAGARADAPRLTGEGPADALGAGLWALQQPGGLDQVMPVLARIGTPGVAAAVGGLLGLRDGCAGMPAHWQRRVRGAAACLALAPGLVRARCREHVYVPGRVGRPPDGPGVVVSGRDLAAVPAAAALSLPPTAGVPEITPLGAGVSMCRPLGRAFRGKAAWAVRKQFVDAVGVR